MPDRSTTRKGRSRWSLWSQDSFLSIGSKGSFLSIGSIGSALSVLSVMSSTSICSIFSSSSRWAINGSGRSAELVEELERGRVSEQPSSGVGFEASRPRL